MVLPLRTAWIADILSQASLRDVERQRCWKRGSGDGHRLWDYLKARLSDLQFNAVDKRGFDAHLNRLQRHRRQPIARERQICTTCLFAESVGLCLWFLPSCAMYKDNAVSNVVAEMGRDLVSTTAQTERSFNAVEGEVRRSPEPSARQPIARSGKFVRRAYSRRALDCAYAFSHRARCTKTTLFETWYRRWAET